MEVLTLEASAPDASLAEQLALEGFGPAAPATEPDLESYDFIVVGFSGGKDSVALVLHLLKMGVSPDRIELHHHEVDGREGGRLMEWPSTVAYCRAFAKAFGLRILFSWKEGGFEREMLRNNTPTAPTHFETVSNGVMVAGGTSGKLGTRRKFPQVSGDLRVRWCSAYLKVDCLDKILVNVPAYQGKRTLVLTGERAQESSNRANYAVFEPGRVNSNKRHIDHWRPVHKWTEQQVWDILREFGVQGHPAYRLGWGRLSCMACIFGSANQWATIRAFAPAVFERIAAYEREFGFTIQRKRSVVELADEGKPFPAAAANTQLFAEAMDPDWDGPIRVDPADWVMPAGAFGDSAGPS